MGRLTPEVADFSDRLLRLLVLIANSLLTATSSDVKVSSTILFTTS